MRPADDSTEQPKQQSDPIERAAYYAFRDLLFSIKSRFLTLTELAQIFHCSTDTMRVRLEEFKDGGITVEQYGTHYRLPICEMPDSYFEPADQLNLSKFAEIRGKRGKTDSRAA